MAAFVNFSIRLPEEMAKTIEEMAAKNDRSRNLEINRLLEFAIENIGKAQPADDDIRAELETVKSRLAALELELEKLQRNR